MRGLYVVATFIAAIFAAQTGAAQTPPNVLFPGAAYSSLARGTNIWCAIDPGSASFQRNVSAPARITVPDITYVNHINTPAVSYRLNGLALLTFASATSGTVAFIVANGAPSSLARPQFTNYAQSYNSTTHALNVAFIIRFPSCALPVRLVFSN
jgi:hypothetical protein